MAIHTDLSPAEAADRLAIRELFDAYAHCADRRDAEGAGVAQAVELAAKRRLFVDVREQAREPAVEGVGDHREGDERPGHAGAGIRTQFER